MYFWSQFHILCVFIFIILLSFSFAIFIFFHWRGHLIVWLGGWFHTFSIHFGLSSAANFTPDYPRSIVDFELQILNDNWINYYPMSTVVYRLFKFWLFEKYRPKTFDFHNKSVLIVILRRCNLKLWYHYPKNDKQVHYYWTPLWEFWLWE